MPITFYDDGSYQGAAIPGWEQQGDKCVPTWPVCRYRRLSNRVDAVGLPVIDVHCLLLKFTGTIRDCLACQQAEAHDSKRPDRSIPADDQGNALPGVIWSPHRKTGPPAKQTYPPPLPGPVVTNALTALMPVPAPEMPVPRPDLQAIQNTLPAVEPDPDRTFKPPIFGADGSIEYPKAEKDWEPPRNINGYVRDPNNKWKFLPLWVPCALRHQMAFLKANCGCIDVVMRCNNPQAPEFAQRLAHDTCAKCPVRKI